MQFAIPLVLISIYISPLVYFLLRKTKWAVINVSVIVLYTINWFYVIQYVGPSAHKFNLWAYTWSGLLASAVIFMLVAELILFLLILPKVNRYVAPIILLFSSVYSFLLITKHNPSMSWSVRRFADYLFEYFTPVFMISFFLFGIVQFVVISIILELKKMRS